MIFRQRTVFLKRLLLALWAVWLTLVFASNLFDACKSIGLLDESWAFASGNGKAVADTTRHLGAPAWLNGSLFLGVICWEGLAASLFWSAWWSYRRGKRAAIARVYTAFTVGLALWGAFLIADELFIAYQNEAVFLRLFVAQLATLLTIELLPESSGVESDESACNH